MYGALIVMEPGDGSIRRPDHIVLLGGAGPGFTNVEMNRSTKPAPLAIKAGVKHRFRFINITPNKHADRDAQG
jgi:hypothetical protein